MGDYVKCRLRDFQFTHKLIQDCLTASQAEMLQKQHCRATGSSIEVGDIVLARVHDHNSKSDPLFFGPHCVIESLHGHRVKILHLKRFNHQLQYPVYMCIFLLLICVVHVSYYIIMSLCYY